MNNSPSLLANLHLVHTTPLGAERIRKNLSLGEKEPVAYCKELILAPDSVISRRGKNWYVDAGSCIITVNAYRFTIITAHKK